jgi:hypothetical protein
MSYRRFRECRQRFDEKLGQPIDWRTEDETEEWQQGADWHEGLKQKKAG